MANKKNQTRKITIGELLSFMTLAGVGGALFFHFLGKGTHEIPTYVVAIALFSSLAGFLIASSKNNWTGFYIGIVLFLYAAISIGIGVEINPGAVEGLKGDVHPNDHMTRIGQSLYFFSTTVGPLFGAFLMIVFPYFGRTQIPNSQCEAEVKNSQDDRWTDNYRFCPHCHAKNIFSTDADAGSSDLQTCSKRRNSFSEKQIIKDT